MLERLWYRKNILHWLLLPLSLLYGAIVVLRRGLYRFGILKSWRAPVPVVIVGNLSVGGNGKTPLVIWLITLLQAQGIKVGVVSRGYGGKAAHYPLTVDADTSPTEAGDEPVLIHLRTKAPVVVAPDRRAAVQQLVQQFAVDLVISDDGLQHYALQRDIEIVVMDGRRGLGNGWWLPAGPLRERAGRLNRVDFVISNGAWQADFKLNKDYPVMQLQPLAAINLVSGEACEVMKLQHLQAMAGIGHPQRFFDMLQQQLQLPVEHCYAFADHQDYQLAQLQPLANSSQQLLMTEKDAVKCRAFAQPNWWYLPIAAVLPQAFETALLQRIKQTIQHFRTK